MSCSRRAFLKKMSLLLLSGSMPMKSFGFGGFGGAGISAGGDSEVSINPLDFIKLINFDCFDCSVKLKGCIKIRFPKKIKIAPKIHYWSPVAFIETGKAWQVREIPYAGIFASLMSSLSEILPIPTGTESYFSGTAHQTYLKVYPHYFGFPKPLASAVASAIALVNLDPICAGCSISDSIEKIVFPQTNVTDALNEYSDKLSEVSPSVDTSVLTSTYSSVASSFPFFPPELFFWTWTMETTHIDRFTIMPFLSALHKAIIQENMLVGKAICPYLTEHLDELGLRFPDELDLEFLCVGHWGYGYPRMGIVRHDDPYVAELLAIARMHHLFSKTIKIIPYKFDVDKTKYQMYAPKKTNCFKPGYKAVDPIADKLFSLDVSNLEMDTLLNKAKGNINTSSLASSVRSKLSSLKTVAKDKRYTGVVVWYKFKKCCW